MKVTGLVTLSMIGKGTKSERVAVRFVTQEDDYLLRRRGGGVFSDPELDKLVGQTVELEGIAHGYTFIITKWPP